MRTSAVFACLLALGACKPTGSGGDASDSGETRRELAEIRRELSDIREEMRGLRDELRILRGEPRLASAEAGDAGPMAEDTETDTDADTEGETEGDAGAEAAAPAGDAAAVAPGQPAAQERVKIYIDSNPGGATVIIGGKPVGRTPMYIEHEPTSEEVLVRLEKNGYRPRLVSIRPEEDARMSFQLAKK